MKEALLTFLAGGTLGIVFAVLKLPIPAPPTISGILGIVGVFLGWIITKNLF